MAEKLMTAEDVAWFTRASDPEQSEDCYCTTFRAKSALATYAECSRLTAEQRGLRGALNMDAEVITALRQRVAEAEAALEPFAHFWRQWERQPMRGLDDEFYCIHTGTEWEASVRRSDCKRAAEVLDAARGPRTGGGE